MKILENLQPEKVFCFFEQICSIPHGSGNTRQISDYCANFAKERGLLFYQDEAGNVVIWKSASPGCENAPSVMLQGHIDMVCEKLPEKEFNFEKDPLELCVDGDFVRADGTTLGGDDGIAAAMMLAVLDDYTITAPPIEAVFTVDEEVGMLGAMALDKAVLKSKLMINMDSENENEFTVGCAGGMSVIGRIPMKFKKTEKNFVKLTVSGAKGGHSGSAAKKGLANTNVLMGRVLFELAKIEKVRIVSINGGQRDNVVTSSTEAELMLGEKAVASAEKLANRMTELFRREYSASDPGIFVKAENFGRAVMRAADRKSSEKVISAIISMPDGVQYLSTEFEGMLQTSLNMGILKTYDEYAELTSCVRSAKQSQKEFIKNKIACIVNSLCGTVLVRGEYPAWEYEAVSPLRDMLCEKHEQVFGKKPDIKVIHAGLECGLFAGAIDGLQCVAVGPDVLDIHSPRERLSISSVQRVWQFLLMALAELSKGIS